MTGVTEHAGIADNVGIVYQDGGGSSTIENTLSDVTNTVVFQLDCYIPESISQIDAGTPKWLNVISAPADGATQTAYDFTKNGTWTFVNNPTDKSLTGDTMGTSTFTLTGSMTSFLNSLAKTAGNQPFWFAMAIVSDGSWSTNQDIFDTYAHGSGQSSNFFGLRVYCTTTNEWTDALLVNTTNNASLGILAGYATGNHLTIYSAEWDDVNSRYNVTSQRNTKPRTVTTATPTGGTPWTQDAAVAARINRNMGAGNVLYRGLSMGIGLMTDQLASDIYDYYETLHGIDYTP